MWWPGTGGGAARRVLTQSRFSCDPCACGCPGCHSSPSVCCGTNRISTGCICCGCRGPQLSWLNSAYKHGCLVTVTRGGGWGQEQRCCWAWKASTSVSLRILSWSSCYLIYWDVLFCLFVNSCLNLGKDLSHTKEYYFMSSGAQTWLFKVDLDESYKNTC